MSGLSHRASRASHPALAGCRVAIERHWLVFLLAPMLVVTGLPFLAPVLMAIGWTSAGTFIYTLYTPFCHQLPQRSWFLFGEKLTYSLPEIRQAYTIEATWQLRFFYGTPDMGWKVAWSDRMISFYSMTPVFGLVYGLLRRCGRWKRPLSWRWFFVLLVPLAMDGGTHVLNDLIYGIPGGGFRDTNSWLVALTGNAFPGFYAGDHLGTFNWWMRLLTGLVAAWSITFTLFPWLDRIFRAESDTYAHLTPHFSP